MLQTVLRYSARKSFTADHATNSTPLRGLIRITYICSEEISGVKDSLESGHFFSVVDATCL